jgi:hypothetical protein
LHTVCSQMLYVTIPPVPLRDVQAVHLRLDSCLQIVYNS